MTPEMSSSVPDLTAVTLARVETKLDNALAKLVEHDGDISTLDARVRAHDTRITVLEASRLKNVPAWVSNLVAGAALVAAVLLGVLK